MPKQRRIIIKTDTCKGILFDEKDTVQAYQILGRATHVDISYNGKSITKTPDEDGFEIVLVAPSAIKDPKPEPEPEPPRVLSTAEEPLF